VFYRRISVCGSVAKTLLNRQLVRLRRKLVCSGVIVAVNRRSVGVVGELVSLLRLVNRMLDLA
jgi:hypothetical protein